LESTFRKSGISFIYITKRKGPNIDPWGIGCTGVKNNWIGETGKLDTLYLTWIVRSKLEYANSVSPHLRKIAIMTSPQNSVITRRVIGDKFMLMIQFCQYLVISLLPSSHKYIKKQSTGLICLYDMPLGRFRFFAKLWC